MKGEESTASRRPMAVTATVVVLVLGGLAQMVWGLVFFAEREDRAALTESGASTAQMAVLAVSMLLLGLATVFLALTLLTGNPGARMMMSIVVAIQVLEGVYAIVGFGGDRRIAGIVTVVVGLGVLGVLFGTASARAFFGETATAPAATGPETSADGPLGANP